MALQPAAGARDLNPGQVESNRRLCEVLSGVYRLWGYQEVAPPTIERLDTLEAGGGIDPRDVVKVVADDPLGLRPEFTASIARAAGTRMAARPRPLRLWATGSTYRNFIGDGGSQRISERIQCGVELLGVASAAADTELIHLLLTAAATLGLQPAHQPRLLVGHHGVLSALLAQVPAEHRGTTRRALTEFDPLALTALPLPDSQKRRLASLIGLRGEPAAVLYQLEQWLGPIPLLDTLAEMLESLVPTATAFGVDVQLDPTFQPHFDLYDGVVLKLVCQGPDAPVAIATGGRYDGLVARFCPDPNRAAGVGFGFDIEAIRDLLGSDADGSETPGPWLVACADAGSIPEALNRMAKLHGAGDSAELCSDPCPTREEAERIAVERGCRGAVWIHA